MACLVFWRGWRWGLLCVAAVAALLGGCGGGEPPKPAASSSPPPPPPDPMPDGDVPAEVPQELVVDAEFMGYRFKLPEGLSLLQADASAKPNTVRWQGEVPNAGLLLVALKVDDRTSVADLKADLSVELKKMPQGEGVETSGPDDFEINGLKGVIGRVTTKETEGAAANAILCLFDNGGEVVRFGLTWKGGEADPLAPLADAIVGSLQKPDAAMASDPGPQRTVMLVVSPLQEVGAKFVTEALTKTLGAEVKIEPQQQGEGFQFTLKPLIDIERITKNITFGKVANVDSQQRTVTVEADVTKVPQDPEKVANDPQHPGYFAQNLAFLTGPAADKRQSAFERLTAADVKLPPELTASFARAMKDRAFDAKETPDIRTRAMAAMVAAGGKFSVPLLCQLLKDKDQTVSQAAMQKLAELKDEQSIAAVAEVFCKQPEQREAAAALLKEFGPAAEEAVLEFAPTDKAENIRPVLALLGEIGTRKSSKYLAQLRSKRQLMEIIPDLNNAVKGINDRKSKKPD